MLQSDGPRSGVGFGIVYGNLDLQMAEVAPAEPLGHFSRFSDRIPRSIEPDIFAKPDGLDNQGVALPFARRVAVERGLRIARQRTAVGEDLAVIDVLLIENRNQSWH